MILYEAIMALVGSGDKVAIPNPSWVSYEAMIGLAEGKVVWLPTKPENGFMPDDDFYSALENSGAKVAIVNSPSNPTGTVYSEQTLKKIVDICERKGIFLVSDEPYEKFLYEGAHFSPGSVYERTLTVNAFSKSYGMTGWRVGYAGCPDAGLIGKMKLIQEQSTSGPTSFAQHGALACFTPEAEEAAKKMAAEFKSRRDHVMNLMEDMDVVCKKPAGAFYVFPKFKAEDDVALADKLLAAGVGTIPGSPFGSCGKGCLRISYGSAVREKLTQAFEKIRGVL
jgi:aspartate aminotransferase